MIILDMMSSRDAYKPSTLTTWRCIGLSQMTPLGLLKNIFIHGDMMLARILGLPTQLFPQTTWNVIKNK